MVWMVTNFNNDVKELLQKYYDHLNTKIEIHKADWYTLHSFKKIFLGDIIPQSLYLNATAENLQRISQSSKLYQSNPISQKYIQDAASMLVQIGLAVKKRDEYTRSILFPSQN